MDTDKNVLWLDIPMNNMLLMQIFQSSRHLSNILRSLPFWEAVFSSEMLVKLAFAGELENEEHSLAVMEMSVELKDVGVSKVALDFNFSSYLPLHITTLQLVFM